jgi:hypothetical protein
VRHGYSQLVVAALLPLSWTPHTHRRLGQLLAGEFGRYPAIFRPAGDMSGFVLIGIFVGMCAWLHLRKGLRRQRRVED